MIFLGEHLSQQELRKKLDVVIEHRKDVASLGDKWTREYIRSYADFIDAGGILHIEQYMTTNIFDSLLENGPFLPAVAPAVLYGKGRFRLTGLREDVQDDIHGQLGTHSVVIYGKTKQAEYLAADPWKGRTVVCGEALVAAMQAAQVECDNLLFTVSRQKK